MAPFFTGAILLLDIEQKSVLAK